MCEVFANKGSVGIGICFLLILREQRLDFPLPPQAILIDLVQGSALPIAFLKSFRPDRITDAHEADLV